jgi:hypothetical protein
MKLYEYKSMPLKEATTFVNGEKYVTSSGEVLVWEGEKQEFTKVLDSPLDWAYENNTMENLTVVQLKLFWKLCK